jgi:type II secretory pathway pseudopilin PulG
MNMKKCHHPQRQGGFTISEVVLAIGVVAFGLVAVLGVLPVGLAATKDNREETIIRYEALYWINAIRAGAQQFDALNQVEWAEIRVWEAALDPETDLPTKVFRVHRARLGGDGWDGSGNLNGMLYRGHLKQIFWPTDVIGWLSIPDQGDYFDLDGDGLLDNVKVKKTVLVRPMNSTLFDRIYGRKLLVANKGSYNTNLLGEPRNSTIYHPLDGGDLAFAYLLEVSIEEDPVYGPALHKVKLTFRWPVLDDPTIEDPTKNASDVAKKTISKMVFTTEIAGALKEAVTSNQLISDAPPGVDNNATMRMRHTVKSILEIVLPGAGEEVTVEGLESEIPQLFNDFGQVVLLNGGDRYITKKEIEDALKYLSPDLPIPDNEIMKEMTGSLPPADQIWSMRRQPYSGYGHNSMRPMSGAADGGYEPIWSATGRFLGFQPPPLPWTPSPYFSQQYFFTPDNQ